MSLVFAPADYLVLNNQTQGNKQALYIFLVQKGCKLPHWSDVKDDTNFLKKLCEDQSYCANKTVWQDDKGNIHVKNR